MTHLAVEHLVHDYPNGVRALDDVTFRIEPGESVGFIGQNGSGKTTLARHLNGLLRPTSGRVLVDGNDAVARRVADLARVVGLVFQDPDRQIFSGSVRREVEFGARNVGLRGEALERAVAGALEQVGLTADAATNPYDLGSARRKLLALASVLSMETPVLVLDEPTTGQDRTGVERVLRVVTAATAARRTVITISHDLRFVARACDRVVVLRAGRVALDASPANAFAANNWETLRLTGLEPPPAAVAAHHLGLGAIATEEELVSALSRR